MNGELTVIWIAWRVRLTFIKMKERGFLLQIKPIEQKSSPSSLLHVGAIATPDWVRLVTWDCHGNLHPLLLIQSQLCEKDQSPLVCSGHLVLTLLEVNLMDCNGNQFWINLHRIALLNVTPATYGRSKWIMDFQSPHVKKDIAELEKTQVNKMISGLGYLPYKERLQKHWGSSV